MSEAGNADEAMAIGTMVEWTSQAGGYSATKSGSVVEIIPAGEMPNLTPYRQSHAIMCDPASLWRNHESYLVSVDRGPTKKPALYWPRVAQLRAVGEAPVCPSCSRLTSERDEARANLAFWRERAEALGVGLEAERDESGYGYAAECDRLKTDNLRLSADLATAREESERLRNALNRIGTRCEVNYIGHTFDSCLDEMAYAKENQGEYPPAYLDSILSGKQLCRGCVVKQALALTQSSDCAAGCLHESWTGHVDGLHEQLDWLKAGQPLIRSEALTGLAKEVIKSQSARQQEDIGVWAQRIADDVSDLTD